MDNVALLPGSFDPPHIGHVKLITSALQRSDIDHAVLYIVHNPLKKRLFSAENSAALLLEMIPKELRDKISIDCKGRNMGHAYERAHATHLIRGLKKKITNVAKEKMQEAAIAFYYAAKKILHFRKPPKIVRIPQPLELYGMSSTMIRRTLIENAADMPEKLLRYMPKEIAGLLVDARNACPGLSYENCGRFNDILAAKLDKVPVIQHPALNQAIHQPVNTYQHKNSA